MSEANKTQAVSVFTDTHAFADAQRMVAPLAAAVDLVPPIYRNNIPNCMIALEMSHRIGMSPLMVMQNMNIIHGRNSWGSSFIIALVNSCGRFTPLRFRYTGEGDSRACRAYAKAKEDGEMIEGPEVSIKMAKDQGWFGKSGSKWPSMPELMLSYRAAAFFGRLYCPDVLMGLPTDTEIVDIGEDEFYSKTNNGAIQDINNQVSPPPPPAKEDPAETVHFEEVNDEVKEMEVYQTEEVGKTPPPPPIADPGTPPPPPGNTPTLEEDDDF